jgi:hypothetical protein
MLTVDKTSPKLGIPPNVRDRYVVRCVNASFGPSTKGNPMITLEWEVVGKPEQDGTVSPTIERNGQKWQVAGLRVSKTYLTLTPKNAERVIEFYEKFLGIQDPVVDETNPDMTPFKTGFMIEAIISSEESVQRYEATEEERAAGKYYGEPILDGEGNQIKTQYLTLGMMLKRFVGEVSNPF